MATKRKFIPNWYEEPAVKGTYRSLFKWGGSAEFKHPNSGLVKLMMETFKLEEHDLLKPFDLGLEEVPDNQPIRMEPQHVEALRAICGETNLHTDTYTRLSRSYGSGMIDALRLRRHIFENLPELVVTPNSSEEVQQVINYCNENNIVVNIFGAGSTVTRGVEAVCKGITIDLSVHMNRLVEFNETDQTITVQPGMTGPELEELLNNAPERLGAKRRYTCGHFPQSFEYSSVGGWVVTRGAGQNSTYYGKIEDIVISQRYITPRGEFKTCPHPRSATGPDFDQIMIGSEGTFGVLTEVTLRIFRWQPENRCRYSYMFKNWDEAMAACREIMQSECGYPSVFRLSDPEETDIAMKLYHIEGTPADSLLKVAGYKPMQKCLLLGLTDGEKGFSRNVNRQIRRICRAHGAFNISIAPATSQWEKGRFRDPYMREAMQDFGILTDTLECAVTWSQMKEVHARVRGFIKNHPNTICMTHLSHAYPQGGNLYFIFISKIDTINEYLDLQYGILTEIQKSGAAISHHHGVGKQSAPWLEGQIGNAQMDVIRALKKHFDPQNIMNPGGTLGLDMSAEQKEMRWSKNLEE